MNRAYTSNRSNRIASTTRQSAAKLLLMTLLGALVFVMAVPTSVLAGATLPDLGTAGSFGVLAGSAVTNTGSTVVDGDVGVSPGTSVTGFPPGIATGTIHAGDAVAAQAQNDATIAYNDAAGQACDFNLTGQDLGGMTLIPGVYCFDSSAQLTGQLTLDGQGAPNAVFIFQIGSTLTTASNASVGVINGAQPCNIFWQVGSSATLGTNTDFMGNILALTSITLNTGASTNTGLYALNGAVTLDTNQVQACGFGVGPTNTPIPVPTDTATATSMATATSTATVTTLPSTNTATPAATNTRAATSTATATATDVPSTATSIPEATGTPTPRSTNVATLVATNTPINTPTNTQTITPRPSATDIPMRTPGVTNTPTPTRTPTLIPNDTAVPSNTTIASVTAISTAPGTATGTAIETPTSTSIAATPTTVIATGTQQSNATATAPVGRTSTPISTVAVPGNTSVTTQVTVGPTPGRFLPSTGDDGGRPSAGLLALLLSGLLLLIGLSARMLFRKSGYR